MTTTHHSGIIDIGGCPRPVKIWSYLTADQIIAATGTPVDVDRWVIDGWEAAVASAYWTYDPAWTPPETVPAEYALDVLIYVESAAAGGGLACVAELRDDTETPMAASDVADLLGVRLDTVMKWRQRQLLPASVATVGGRPVWNRETIVRWARSSGRA